MNGMGFYIGNTGVIEWNTSVSQVNILNVFNVTATGDITTSGVHHVGSGTDATNGGYWLGSLPIIAGSGNVNFYESGARSWYMTAGGSNYQLSFIGGRTGNQGILLDDTGASSAFGSGTKTIITGLFALSSKADTPGLVVQPFTGQTADIMDVLTAPGASTSYLQVLPTGWTRLNNGVIVSSLYSDVDVFVGYGYPSGNADLISLYNQGGGTEEFAISRAGRASQYAGIFTQGLGLSAIYGSIAWHAVVSGPIGNQNITCGGAMCAAGVYRFSAYTACPLANSLQIELTWYDGIFSGATTFFTCTAGSFNTTTSQVFYSDGSHHIMYSIPVVTGAPSFAAILERLQ